MSNVVGGSMLEQYSSNQAETANPVNNKRGQEQILDWAAGPKRPVTVATAATAKQAAEDGQDGQR